MATPTLFLTGATGFLGHYTLADLVRRSVRCRALVSAPIDRSRARLSSLLADLGVDLNAAERDGLVELVAGRVPDSCGPALLRGTDRILHIAASTDFRATPDGEPYRTNVDGTRALAEAARTAGVREFMLVSTAYVGGLRDTVVPEAAIDAPDPGANDYERSKWIAEQAAFDLSRDGIDVLICRPSILFGDRASARTTHFGGVYILARAVELLARAIDGDSGIERHRVPLRIMGDANSTLNLAPVCWAAHHVAKLATQAGWPRRVVHLVNPAPPTCGEIKRWLEACFDLGGGSFTVDRWPWANPSRCEEAFYAAGEFVHGYFRRSVHFETSYLDQCGENGPLTDGLHFKRCVDFARRHDWGRRRQSAAMLEDCVDPVWYFEDFMVERLPESPVARLEALTAVVRYVISDVPHADWICRYQAGRLAGIDRANDASRPEFGFRVDRDAFSRIVRGRQGLQAAYFAGQAEMFGDILRATKMVPVIDAFLRQFPVTRRSPAR